jgi:hypothetical protein
MPRYTVSRWWPDPETPDGFASEDFDVVAPNAEAAFLSPDLPDRYRSDPNEDQSVEYAGEVPDADHA